MYFIPTFEWSLESQAEDQGQSLNPIPDVAVGWGGVGVG